MNYFTDLWPSFGCISEERIRESGHRQTHVERPNTWAMMGRMQTNGSKSPLGISILGAMTCTLKRQRERGKNDSNVNLV